MSCGFELVRSDGSRFICSPIQNADWFAATVGGLGLTGLISWAEIRLRPIVSRKIQYQGIKFIGIDEFVALSQASTQVEYTVAWIDCVASGKNFARGIFMQGDHSSVPEPAAPTKAPWLSVPIDFPDIALNRLSVGVFNTLYYNKQFSKRKTGVSRLRAVLLSAGQHFALEQDLWPEWTVAVSMRDSLGRRAAGRESCASSRRSPLGAGLVPGGHQGLRRYSLAGNAFFP